ncbi:hypothetical protein FPANT_8121 [Fusarium pseudoanthophilum]|uniref:Uncharacterized protein n=1 Tax=Fusarium pseudoanthophilum TaxID=48495 RepID=A0A8H5L3J2_9HYPO|nr:hypothetical protein FPANT_8121 [Fusarium pseudoanthophilum]
MVIDGSICMGSHRLADLLWLVHPHTLFVAKPATFFGREGQNLTLGSQYLTLPYCTVPYEWPLAILTQSPLPREGLDANGREGKPVIGLDNLDGVVYLVGFVYLEIHIILWQYGHGPPNSTSGPVGTGRPGEVGQGSIFATMGHAKFIFNPET